MDHDIGLCNSATQPLSKCRVDDWTTCAMRAPRRSFSGDN